MSLLEFIEKNISADLDPLLMSVVLGIIWIIIHDFYHLLFSAVLSWFKSKK